MKSFLYVITLLLGLGLGACTPTNKAPEPAVAEHGRSVEEPFPKLSAIDSLMWQQPDSALAVMLEFSASSEADSLSEFEGHYCQVLIAELLFKNDYAQSNRTEVLKAVDYFDSIDNAFLAARAHYSKGVGYYERDSLIEACTEYLNTLRIMESHFGENELVGKKARFMALTYNRLLDLFKSQLMPEPAIYCARQSLIYTQIAPTSLNAKAIILYQIGLQHDILRETDSAVFYYETALNALHNRKTTVYRDIISSWALFQHNRCNHTQIALDSLKSMAAQAESEIERITRYSTIGDIYHDAEQLDSAKFYKELVFEFAEDAISQKLAAKVLHDIAISEGDTLKANQYAQFLIEDVAAAAENQKQISKLNDLFQNYLQEKQEAASLRERKKAVRTALAVVLPFVVVLAAVVVILMRRRNKIRMAIQQAEAQRRLSEVSQRLSEASQRRDEAERELQTKVEQAAQHTREILQQRVTDIYQSNGKDRLQRILEAVDDTYPQTVARLKSEYPELSETERNILLLNFFHFRIKEEADLLGLSENTVGKYRSNLGKTLGKDPISDWV